MRAQHRAVFRHPGHADGSVEIAEAAVQPGGKAGEAALRAAAFKLARAHLRGGAEALPRLGRNGQAECAQLAPHGDRAVGHLHRSAVACRAGGDHEGGPIAALQLRRQPVGTLAVGEPDLRLRIDPRRHPRSQHARLFGILAVQLHDANGGHGTVARIDAEGQRHALVPGGEAAGIVRHRGTQRRPGRRAAQTRGKVGGKGALVFVGDQTGQRCLDQRIAHRWRGAGTDVGQGQRLPGPGDRGGADRLEGRRHVHDAAAIDLVRPDRTRIKGRAQQDVGNLSACQVRKGLCQQGRRARNLWCCKTGAGQDVDVALGIDVEPAVLVDTAYAFAPCGDVELRVRARAIAEVGDLVVLVHRPHHDHAAVTGHGCLAGKRLQLRISIIACGHHDQRPGIDSSGNGPLNS